MSDSVIIIPSRLESQRLPNKPLALIQNRPMILHVYEKAIATLKNDSYVACSEEKVKEVVEKANGKAIITDPDLASGSDRVHSALETIDPNQQYKYIINLQGDLPDINPDIIRQTLSNLKNNDEAEIMTPVIPITKPEEIQDPNVVKAILATNTNKNVRKALYFTRGVPYGDGDFFYHVGVYVYKREALERFVKLSKTNLEKRENLEQLRALEDSINIYATIIQTEDIPISIDTQADLDKLKAKYA